LNHIDYITCGLGKDRLEKAYLLFPDLHNISAANKSRGDALTISTCRRNFLLEDSRRLRRDVTFYKHVTTYNSRVYTIALHIISPFEY